jgi:TrmH family RNA methyltransferase
MRVKLILVEPKYQVNLGYIARTAMNFGVERLYVVNPRASLRGKGARMYSKHAYHLLEGAKTYRNLGEATKDCDLILGTTGITKKAKANFKRIYFAEEAVRRIRRRGGRTRVGLLIGRDDIGLTSDEISRCDMLAYIGTNPTYPVLNVSHALAILLYLMRREELRESGEGGMRGTPPEAKETEMLLRLFEKMISRKRMRNRKAVLSVFRRMIRSTQPSRQELHALITALK